MQIRPAAVAGMFYPSSPDELASTVGVLLSKAERKHTESLPVALIVPHAGYIYSGATAASAYTLLQGIQDFEQVLLLGPGHRVAVRGLAFPSVDFFQTPLGNFPVAGSIIKELVKQGYGAFNDRAHQQEHSLEVQLPFLQVLSMELPLIPVVVGQAEPEEISLLIEKVTAQANTLILVSSDLSHFHSYETARCLDQDTSHQIEQLDETLQPEQACGCRAINGLLHWLQQRKSSIHEISRCNSGDIPGIGDKSRVVGYGAYVVYS